LVVCTVDTFCSSGCKWEQTDGRKVNLRGEETVDNFKKIGKKIVDFLGVFIPNITFLVIFLTFMVTIVSRYFFKTPVTWSYEVSVLGYMWTMFFGVGKAMEADEHVVFGLVYDAVKPRTQFIFKVVYNTFLLILLVICFVPCFQSMVGKKMVTGVLKLPYTVVFAPFMYMLAEIIVRTCINIRNAFKEYKEGGKES
jgi:TRAP-type C4-dicarboxylate transport system permease small subunit